MFAFLICINTFNDSHPNFIDINLWDFFNFILTELLSSLIVGYTNKKEDKAKIENTYMLESYGFYKNSKIEFLSSENTDKKNSMYNNDELKVSLLDKVNK
jgi:hypothetical protein